MFEAHALAFAALKALRQAQICSWLSRKGSPSVLQKGSPSAVCAMAVAKPFDAVADRFTNAMPLAADIHSQITEMKRRMLNCELDKLHGQFHTQYLAPATGAEQKLSLMLLCPGYSDCSKPCLVGKVCELYTYPSWASDDGHQKNCAWALHNLQRAFHEYFACDAVQRGSQGWNGAMDTWTDIEFFHVLTIFA